MKNILMLVMSLALPSILWGISRAEFTIQARNKKNKVLFYSFFIILVLVLTIFMNKAMLTVQQWTFGETGQIFLPLSASVWLWMLVGMFYSLSLGAILEVKIFGRNQPEPKFPPGLKGFLPWTVRNKSKIITFLFLLLAWLIEIGLNTYIRTDNRGIYVNHYLQIQERFYPWENIEGAHISLELKKIQKKYGYSTIMDPEYVLKIKDVPEIELWEAYTPIPGGRTDTNALANLTRLLLRNHVPVENEYNNIFDNHRLKQLHNKKQSIRVLSALQNFQNVLTGLDKLAYVGDSIGFDDIIYTLLYVENIDRVGYYQSGPKRTIWQVGLQIKNNKNVPWSLPSFMSIHVSDHLGSNYTALITEKNGLDDIQPGETRQGSLYFSLPREGEDLVLVIKPSLIDNDLIRFSIDK